MTGGKQLGFSDYELTTAKKPTKREQFLAEIEAIMSWEFAEQPPDWPRFFLLSADCAPFELVFSDSAAHRAPDFRRFALLGPPDRGLMAALLGNHLFTVTPLPSLATPSEKASP